MNPLTPLPCPPNGPGEPLPCAQVWSQLTSHQCDALERVLLQVCCQLAHLNQSADHGETPTPLALAEREMAHEGV